MFQNLDDKVELINGYGIPCIGLGTWQAPNDTITIEAVKTAIGYGYRHIDTAYAYENEKAVGQGIRASGVEREEIFITSKLLNDERGYETTKKAIDKSLINLGVDYMDLYLIHWPVSSFKRDDWEEINLGTWQAITEAYKAGKMRAIGVSNFTPVYLDALMKTEVQPMVNQIEYHPGYLQDETVKFCKEHGILVEAWSPLGTGTVLKDERVVGLAEKYGKSVAQFCIRWCLQNGIVPLPKSVTAERIRQNAHVFDFEISQEDMDFVNAMPEFCYSGKHPDTIDF